MYKLTAVGSTMDHLNSGVNMMVFKDALQLGFFLMQYRINRTTYLRSYLVHLLSVDQWKRPGSSQNDQKSKRSSDVLDL